jgi:hypothetical protein
MEGSDEGNVGAAQQMIVEDERGYYQSVGAALRCWLHEHRHTKIEMRVVFTENDLVMVSLEYPKNVYPIAPFGLEIDCSLKTERLHENVSESQQYHNPLGRPCKDVSCEGLCVVGSSF